MKARTRRLGVALAAVFAVALLGAATASATAARDASLARRGVTLAVQRHWLASDEAQRYRGDVTHALTDISRLPKLRGRVIAVQLQQVTALWDSYTKPRALALFAQLEENLAYLETHIIPPGRIDVAADDGVVYRWFPDKGLEFHPLAAFGALNAAAVAQDTERTGMLSAALVARGVPRGNALIWEYAFPFGFGKPPWASGMAQAVAAQALGRSAALLQDMTLSMAAARAYAAVPSLMMQLSAGPWVRLYGFNREIVLNAQLQSILSLLQYADDTGATDAAALAQRMNAAAQAFLPRFDTGDWSLYELGGGFAPADYQLFVTQLLAKLAARTQDPFWVAASQRFHGYYYDPPQITPGTPPPTIYPQPTDGYLDVAQIPITLSQNASVSLAVAGQVTSFRLTRGPHALTWTPPVGLAQGTYPVQISATNRAGRRSTAKLPPVVVAWDTAPPVVNAQLQAGTLAWQGSDPGTPWLALHVDFADPNCVNPTQTVDLAHQTVSGSAPLTVPPGTWHANLVATNSAGLTTTVDLGIQTG
ncbi:MAG: D-glucuronyl C5-epimerase domain protein [Actinomycetia bacterium]|nr:D-glucuronyl C5-epimerase domain protein [Actinomycetes bacterium]